MPNHTTTIDLPRPCAEVFDFLVRPANLAQLAPPDLALQLIEAPERLALGSTLHWQARRMGVTQALLNEVIRFEEGVRFDEEQRRGPFKRWLVTHRFEPAGGGTRLIEEVTYEPPGGMLGLIVTAAVIQKDIEKLFAFRAARLGEHFPA